MFAVLHHPDCEEYLVPGHPERPQRVKMTLDYLRCAYPTDRFQEAPLSTEEHWLLFHTQEHVNRFNKLCGKAEESHSNQHIDGDTVVTPKTRSAVSRAVGSVIAAVDGIYRGEMSSAFCCVRPPGHHAEPGRAMGFCFMNNAAIAAQYARRKYGVGRVAILDFDVHHGNGTDLGFQGDSGVFYGSTHERDNFPGTGHEPKHKGPQAVQELDRRIVNRYLSPGSISKMQFRTKWAEIISEMELFKPDLIIFSAGFDAHTQDPLGGCCLDETDFAWATQIVLDATYRINPDGAVPCMSVLEGGYNLSAVAKSVVVHCGVLRMHKPTIIIRSNSPREVPEPATTTSSEGGGASPVVSVTPSPEDQRPALAVAQEEISCAENAIKYEKISAKAELPSDDPISDSAPCYVPELPSPVGDSSVERPDAVTEDLVCAVKIEKIYLDN